ncbi:MAG: MFS transporter [Defluviitaleaceae bacterium]|nr:MFS transporter [Defluviitaleaceae bacterium]
MKKKVFYGWYIVVASVLIAAAGIGFHNTASIFIRPVTEDLGLSRGEFTFFRTIVILVGAALLPFYGKLAARFPIRRIMIIGTVMSGLSLIGYSFAANIWYFYFIAVINGMFMNAAHFMMIAILINRWFEDKRGLALGIAFAGSGIGAAVMVPMVSGIIDVLDWRWGFRFSGMASILILVPTILLLIKEKPEDMGLTPYKKANEKDTTQPVDAHSLKGITLPQARKTPTFWFLTIALLLIAMASAAPTAHTAPYLGDIGYPTAVYSAVFSLAMLVLTVGKIFMGYVFDKFGTFVGGVSLGIFFILAPIFALLALNPVMPWLHGVFFGLASTGFSVPINIFILKYFGEKDFTSILGILSMIMAFGAAFAAPAMGISFDILGNYIPAWWVLLGAGMVITLCLIGVNITGKKILN